MEIKYNDWYAVAVLHGRKDTWVYVTFINGMKFTNPLKEGKARAKIKELRDLKLKERYIGMPDREVWKFYP